MDGNAWFRRVLKCDETVPRSLDPRRLPKSSRQVQGHTWLLTGPCLQLRRFASSLLTDPLQRNFCNVGCFMTSQRRINMGMSLKLSEEVDESWGEGMTS